MKNSIKIVLGRVSFGDALPKIEGGWYNQWTGEYGVFK